MPARPANCPTCGARTQRGARFCASCGASLENGSTARAEVPPHETTPAPVTVTRTSPRWFGVTPPTITFGLAAAALVLAIVLLVGGRWIAGLLVLGLALLLFAAFLEVARRKPDAQAVRLASDAADSLLARAGFAAQALRTRSSARREIMRRRGELVRLMNEREALLRELGGAVYRGEEGTSVRTRIAALDERAAALAAEAQAIAEDARARVDRAALAVQPTEVVPSDKPD
jgi:hypothetical protein